MKKLLSLKRIVTPSLLILLAIAHAGHAQSAARQTAREPSTSQRNSNARNTKALKTDAVTTSAIGNDSVSLPAKDVATTNILKVTLSPSETPLKLGSTWNVAVDIQNVSDSPLSIDPATMMLAMHAVMAHEASLCSVWLTPVFNSLAFSKVLVLLPQDHMLMIGDPSRRVHPVTSGISAGEDPCEQKYFGRSLGRLLDFSPGNYEFYLSGSFSVCKAATLETISPNTVCPSIKRSFTQSATFPVAISQTSIVIFSIFGGLFAFVVVTATTAQDTSLNEFISLVKTGVNAGRFWTVLFSVDGAFAVVKVLAGAAGAALLAAAFTVVSSRLSDTHFPVNVTVQDAWGAITVGFISYFLGQRFVRWLTTFADGGSNSMSTPPRNRTDATA